MGVIKHRPEGASHTLKADIARGFGNASDTYDSASRLQRLMGDTLLEKLSSKDALLGVFRGVDLGCGTGWFTRRLAASAPAATLTGVDLSPGMTLQARQNSPEAISWIVGDAEQLPLPDDSCDLVFSNLMIQWCQDFRGVLRESRRVLRPGGWLAVSTLLDGTLQELKTAWEAADSGHQHVNRFETGPALKAGVNAELPEGVVETRVLELPYESPMALAAELRHLGAGFRGSGRRRSATAPGRMKAMCREYPRQPDGTIKASYQAAWIYWQNP